MGRTPKPIRIGCTTDALATSKEVQALLVKGHSVTWDVELGQTYDLIIGPECCAMDMTLVKDVNLAVRRTWERLAGRKVLSVAHQEGVPQSSSPPTEAAGDGVGDAEDVSGDEAEGGADSACGVAYCANARGYCEGNPRRLR